MFQLLNSLLHPEKKKISVRFFLLTYGCLFRTQVLIITGRKIVSLKNLEIPSFFFSLQSFVNPAMTLTLAYQRHHRHVRTYTILVEFVTLLVVRSLLVNTLCWYFTGELSYIYIVWVMREIFVNMYNVRNVSDYKCGDTLIYCISTSPLPGVRLLNQLKGLSWTCEEGGRPTLVRESIQSRCGRRVKWGEVWFLWFLIEVKCEDRCRKMSSLVSEPRVSSITCLVYIDARWIIFFILFLLVNLFSYGWCEWRCCRWRFSLFVTRVKTLVNLHLFIYWFECFTFYVWMFYVLCLNVLRFMFECFMFYVWMFYVLCLNVLRFMFEYFTFYVWMFYVLCLNVLCFMFECFTFYVWIFYERWVVDEWQDIHQTDSLIHSLTHSLTHSWLCTHFTLLFSPGLCAPDMRTSLASACHNTPDNCDTLITYMSYWCTTHLSFNITSWGEINKKNN